MRDIVKQSLAVFGIAVVIAMFANIAGYISNQSIDDTNSPVISAFAG